MRQPWRSAPPPPQRRPLRWGALAAAAAVAGGAALLAVDGPPAAAAGRGAPGGEAPVGRRRAAAALGTTLAQRSATARAEAGAVEGQRLIGGVGSGGRVGGEAVTLSSGALFPKASFGPQAYGFDGDGKARELTRIAVDVGYRNFFASVLARNQRGFAMGLMDSGIARSEVFICGSVDTKSAKGFEQAYQQTKQGCDANLKAFAVGGIDYVDMIMLDYPAADCESILGQWKAFEEMLNAGKTKSLAVSNFGLTQLDCILQNASLPPPSVNQLRFNAEAYSKATSAAIVEENRKRGVVVQAWSPLRVTGRKKDVAKNIGLRYSKSAQQVMLRWIVQSGATYTTQSMRRDHLAENVGIFDFVLSDEEMQLLSA